MRLSVASSLLVVGSIASPATPVIQIPDGQLQASTSTSPVVAVKNGSYSGLYNPTYNQDLFLGIPFAQPPIDSLRFRVPQPLNDSFDVKQATDYAPGCVGYGGDEVGYQQSEDCLYLNVIRPAGISSNASLPVAVWIHGGGLYMGGTVNRRYNLSFIVENSVNIGKPIVGVSIAYRLSGWGFLQGKEALAGGATNLGYRDQRLALHWIKENILAFGGDPTKTTIWGESAGGQSVGAHLLAYNGRDDGLFRAAIAESGGPATYFQVSAIKGSLSNTETPQAIYDTIISNTSCASTVGTQESLDCLRGLPYSEINDAFNTTQIIGRRFNPTLDGDFISDYPSSQLDTGRFVKVPLIIGCNSDEGTAFGSGYGPGGNGVNTNDEFFDAVAGSVIDNATALTLTYLYPDIPAIGIPSLETYSGTYTAQSGGVQFRRTAAYFGDATVIASRRAANQAWARYNTTSYSYRFDVVTSAVTAAFGATHFQEVAFVFDSVDGLGYATNPFANTTAAYPALAKQMSQSWVGFVNDLDPNENGIASINQWPAFQLEGGEGQNFVWTVNGTSYPEVDSFRAEGIAFINEMAKKAYGR